MRFILYVTPLVNSPEPCTHNQPTTTLTKLFDTMTIEATLIVVISYDITSPSFTDQTIPGC